MPVPQDGVDPHIQTVLLRKLIDFVSVGEVEQGGIHLIVDKSRLVLTEVNLHLHLVFTGYAVYVTIDEQDGLRHTVIVELIVI